VDPVYTQLPFVFPPAVVRYERVKFGDAFHKRFLGMHDHICAYCGEYAGTIDHFVPVALGGSNAFSNLYPACISCNSTAHWRLFDSFEEKQRYILQARVRAGSLRGFIVGTSLPSHDWATCIDCGDVYRYAGDATIFLCPVCRYMDEHRPLPSWRRKRIDSFLVREFPDGAFGGD
jgi:hypothetical protein